MPYKDHEKQLEYMRKKRKDNLPRYAAKQKQYYIDNPGTYLRNVCKSRAKKLGLEFNLEPEDFVIPEFCPIFGVKLERGGKGYHENAPSVDRLDPSKGYVKGNISIISFRANKLKGDATSAELRRIADWMDSQNIPNVIDPDLIELGRELGQRLIDNLNKEIEQRVDNMMSPENLKIEYIPA